MIGALRALREDAAVRWLVLSRLLALAGAPVTRWLALTRLTDADRAAYLIAVNVAALGPLFETGPGTLLVQFVSRGGAATASIQRLAKRWYAVAAVMVVLVVGIGGLLWIRGSAALRLDSILVAWTLLVLSVSGYVALVPALCVLEGSAGRAAIQRLRAAQAALTLVLLVGGLWSGFGFQAAALAALGVLLLTLWFLGAQPPGLEGPLPHAADDMVSSTDYNERQRRSAWTWLALWSAPQALTPLVWRFGSPAVAGVLGVHVGLALAPTILAIAWMHARFPSFGCLAAAGSLVEFDTTVRRATGQAVSVFFAASAALAVFILTLRGILPVEAATRLSLPVTLLLLVGSFVLLLVQAMLAWLRAFTEEPLTIPVVVAAGLALLGGSFGAVQGGALGGGVGHALGSLMGFCYIALLFLRARASRLNAPTTEVPMGFPRESGRA